MKRGPVADGWAGSLFPEPITQAKPILLDDKLEVLALLRNERGELYCNCYGMIVKERKCHKCVGYVSESDTCRWVMSVHDAELVNGKWTGLTAPMVSHEDDEVVPLEPTVKKLSILDEPLSLDFSKEWYYCASGNAIRNHLPCDECIRSEPREEIHCIRFFKLHPCAYFNSAHCNGSTCEYWSPYGDNPHCTYGPYPAWLAATSVPVADAPTVKGIRMPEYSFATGAKFGEKPEHTEAEAHEDDLCSGCLCHKCDYSLHICKSCEDPAACTTRGKHTVACSEFSGLKKPSRKELAKAKKSKPEPLAVKPKQTMPDGYVTDLYCEARGEECLVRSGCVHGSVACRLKDAAKKEPIALLLDGKWYSEGKEITEAEANAPIPQSCSGCLCQTCINIAMCNHCQATAICAKYNARTVACPAFSKAEGEGWTCSDCLCPKCANNKENCHDCKGPVYCSKHGGKMGGCPDFRASDGMEQDCMHNGCLCIGCERVGQQCKECVGPIRCPKPTVECKEYVGAEVEA